MPQERPCRRAAGNAHAGDGYQNAVYLREPGGKKARVLRLLDHDGRTPIVGRERYDAVRVPRIAPDQLGPLVDGG